MKQLSASEKKEIESFDPTGTMEFEIVKTFAMQRKWYIQLWTAAGIDIEGAQWNTLNRLWKEDGLNQVQIGRLINQEKPYVTRMLDQMQKKGWIIREPDPNDRRAFLIFLTEEGKALRYQLVPLFLEARKKALKGISEEDQEQMKGILARIQQNMI